MFEGSFREKGQSPETRRAKRRRRSTKERVEDARPKKGRGSKTLDEKREERVSFSSSGNIIKGEGLGFHSFTRLERIFHRE